MIAEHEEFDAVVAGGGLAGLTATLALARNGYRVMVAAPSGPRLDGRTTAILDRSLRFLDRLGVGAAVRRLGSPLATMRIIDATGRLVQAPPVTFHSGDIGLEAFGYNVENTGLADLLREAALREGALLVDTTVAEIRSGSDSHDVKLGNGQQTKARILVGADGRGSVVRAATGIGAREWRYPQSAVVLNFEHQLPHDDASTEFHTRSGPFTLVPLREKQCSLVWIVEPAEADRLKAIDRNALAAMIEKRMQSMLGRIEIASDVQAFPIAGMIAHRFGTGNTVLIGEAAHVLPPVGAQGFNLGVRDIETLVDILGRHGSGQAGIGERYHGRRIADVGTRSFAIHAFNRSLLSDFLPSQLARTVGLSLVGSLAPLKRLAMREGLAPGAQMEHLLDTARQWIDRPRYPK